MEKKNYSISKYSKIYGLETKQSDSDDLIKGGFIATTHLDDGFYDEVRNLWIKDKIDKSTLDLWAKEINEGIPRANKVSVHHDRDKHVTGKGLKDTAVVLQLNDGYHGLYVDTLIDKTKPNYEDTKYRLENEFLDSFSIEFTTKDPFTGEYLDGAVSEQTVGDGIVRTLLPGTLLEGWTLASQPMNDNAIMIKEVLKENIEQRGVNTMTENKDKIENLEKKEDENVSPKEESPNEESPKEESPGPSEGKHEISAEDLKILNEAKERKEKENKNLEIKEIKDSVLESLKESMKDVKIDDKVNVDNKEESKVQDMFKEFKESVKSDSKLSLESQFKEAGKLSDSLKLTSGDIKPTSRAESRNYDFSVTKEGAKYNMEYKALGITSNQNTDTDYLLSSAELSDVFDPVIYNAINQNTVLWNLLAKDDFSNKGNNQVQFTLKITANATASAYTGNAVATGNVGRQKYMTKFKKYQVGIEVDGDMIAAARGGPIGDIFAQEVRDSTEDLLAVVNAALFAEVGLESAAGIIGLEYITDSAGNATLYNVTRSAANRLAPASAGDTYINGSSARISLTNLAAAMQQAKTEKARVENLIFVCHPLQERLYKDIYRGMQRFVPLSSRFGFEGMPEFDGVPIFADTDCNNDDWFLVDLETHRVAIWVPFTLEKLGKDADSEKGFVKGYFATYNRAPRRMVQIYGNATS